MALSVIPASNLVCLWLSNDFFHASQSFTLWVTITLVGALAEVSSICTSRYRNEGAPITPPFCIAAFKSGMRQIGFLWWDRPSLIQTSPYWNLLNLLPLYNCATREPAVLNHETHTLFSILRSLPPCV